MLFQRDQWPFIPSKLSDIIDADTLAVIQAGSCERLGRALTLFDYDVDQKILTHITPINPLHRYEDFCAHFRSRVPDGAQQCEACDAWEADISLSAYEATGDPFRLFYCHMGLYQASYIIRFYNRPVGVLVGGQYRPPEGVEEIQANVRALWDEPEPVDPLCDDLVSLAETLAPAVDDLRERLATEATYLEQLAYASYQQHKHEWEQQFLGTLRNFAQSLEDRNFDDIREFLQIPLELTLSVLRTEYAVFFARMQEGDSRLEYVAGVGIPDEVDQAPPYFDWERAWISHKEAYNTPWDLIDWQESARASLYGPNADWFQSCGCIVPLTPGSRHRGALILGPFAAPINLERERNFLIDIGDLMGTSTFIRLEVQRLEHERHQLRQVLEASHRITTIQPIDETLQEIIRELLMSLDYDIVVLYRYDPYLREFEKPIAAHSVPLPFFAAPVGPASLLWELIRRSENDSHFTSNPHHDRLMPPLIPEIKASGYIRLSSNGQVVGLLFVHKCVEHTFSKAERETTQQLAEQAAQVIYETLILQSIADSLREMMKFDVVILYPYNADQNKLGYPVFRGRLKTQPDPELPDDVARIAIQAEKPSHFVDDAPNDPIFFSSFVEFEEILSSGYVRLEVDGEPVGLLLVSWRRRYHWTDSEKQAVHLFANQAAIAIWNARLYQSAREEAQRREALYEAAKAIVRGGLETETVLNTILEQAMKVTGAHFGTLQRVVGDYLEFVAVQPADRLIELKSIVGQIPIDGQGITARAVRMGEAQLVPDVQQDPDFQEFSEQTCSELAVVLRASKEEPVIGVLNVEHPEVGGLDRDDRRLLIALSNLAVIALQTAQTSDELRFANTIALMAAWEFNIAHDVNAEAGRIRRAVYKLGKHPDLPDDVIDQLNEIDRYAENLALPMKLERPPEVGRDLPYEDAAAVDRVIKEEVKNLRPRHAVLKIHLALHCPGIKVNMHSPWLRRVIRHLLSNADRVIRESRGAGEVTITTHETDESMIEVRVEDTGPGIPPDIAAQLFKRQIQHEDDGEHGKGTGLFLISLIIKQYGGNLELISSGNDDSGACFRFTIPRADRVVTESS